MSNPVVIQVQGCSGQYHKVSDDLVSTGGGESRVRTTLTEGGAVDTYFSLHVLSGKDEGKGNCIASGF